MMSPCKSCTISRYEVLCVEEVVDQDIDIFNIHQDAVDELADVLAGLDQAHRAVFLNSRAYNDAIRRRAVLDEISRGMGTLCPDCTLQTDPILRVMVKLDVKLISFLIHRMLFVSTPTVDTQNPLAMPRRLERVNSYDNEAFDPIASVQEPSTSTLNNAQEESKSDTSVVIGQKRKADTNLHMSLNNLTLDARAPLQEDASLEESRGAAHDQGTTQNADLAQASGTTFNVDPSLDLMVTPKKRASRERMAALVTTSLQSIFNRPEFDPSKHTNNVTITSSVSHNNLAASENVSRETSVSILLSDLERSLCNLVPPNTEESSEIALSGENRSSNENMAVPSTESEGFRASPERYVPSHEGDVPSPEDGVPEGLLATITKRLYQDTGPSPSRPNLARIMSRMRSTNPDIHEEAMNNMFFLLQSHLPVCKHKSADDQALAAGAEGCSEHPTHQEEEEASGEPTTPSNQKDANIPTPVRRWKKKPLRGKRKKKR